MRKLDGNSLLRFYKLKQLERYNTSFRLTHETVSDHSYYVALFTQILMDMISIDFPNILEFYPYAMRKALHHDLPEIVISDIPRPSKIVLGINDKKYEQLEDEIIDSLLPYTQNELKKSDTYYQHYSKQIDVIVEIADVLSVYQFCRLEDSLGNTHLKHIYEDVITRIESLNDRFKSLIGRNINYYIDMESLTCFNSDSNNNI